MKKIAALFLCCFTNSSFSYLPDKRILYSNETGLKIFRAVSPAFRVEFYQVGEII